MGPFSCDHKSWGVAEISNTRFQSEKGGRQLFDGKILYPFVKKGGIYLCLGGLYHICAHKGEKKAEFGREMTIRSVDEESSYLIEIKKSEEEKGAGLVCDNLT